MAGRSQEAYDRFAASVDGPMIVLAVLGSPDACVNHAAA